MARELRNWLTAYNEWTLPRSEAPASMILWAGLYTLASVAKRKVYFPRKMMGSYEIFPSLYVVFVGNPGVVRKSTTAGYAEDLLALVSDSLEKESITFAATVTSDSKLLSELSESPDGSLAIISSEFSSLVKATPEGMYAILTNLFDNKKKFDQATQARGVELTDNPCVNLLAATTPAWISGQPKEYFLGGGFASRILFVFETRRRQFRMYYDDLDYTRFDDIERKLLDDLKHISTLKGEFKHENKALHNEMEKWYQKHAKKENEDTRTQGYAERKHIHLHKVAMLLSLAERDDLVITKTHFDKGLELLDEIEGKLPKALATVGNNPLGGELDLVRDFISERGKVTRRQLASRFYRDLSLEQLGELITALNVMEEIKIIPNGKNPQYKWTKPS